MGLLFGEGLMLHAARHDEQLTLSQHNLTVA
jgi:hypothetical protein